MVRRRLPALAALAVATAVAAFTLPRALTRWWLTPDVIEHLTIAHAWVSGAGFVDPVQWNFFLHRDVPLPAFAVRAPAVSVLAAIPLALGGSLTAVTVLHALWSSAVAGGAVLVTRRFAGPAAALAAGLWLGLSPAWIRASAYVLTEVTAVAALLGVIATSRGVLRSVPAALCCSAATVLAWTARPNLIALALAVVVAAVVELGARRASRHRPLWAYALGVVLGTAAIGLAVELATGLRPYAGYGAARELFGADDGFRYQKEYVGAWRFVSQHGDEVWRRMVSFSRQLFSALCLGPRFHYAGWLLLPGLLHALVRRGPGALEQRVAAFAGAGLAGVTVAYFAAFDAWRYPMLPAACAILAGVPALEAAARWLGARRPGAAARALPAATLAAATLAVLATSLPGSAAHAATQWHAWRERGTRDGSSNPVVRALEALCPALGRASVVASVEPWNVTLRCGPASIRLPVDLDTPEWQDRFLDEKHVTHLLADGSPVTAWLATSSRLHPVAAAGPYVLYRVIRPSTPASAWLAPPPAACAGRGRACPGSEPGAPDEVAGDAT